jgi:hypothetical protein
MHGSMSGGQLRATLAPFQPSEQEYRAIFPVYQAFQQQFPSQMAGLSTEQAAARRIAEEQMNTQLTALIGADRAADFKQAIDPTANQLNRLVARLELPISAAAQVVALQKDIQNRAMAVTSNASLSSTDRSAQYAALTTEAATKLTTTLGARGLEAYKQYGGQWLQNIAPTPPGGAPKP